MRAYFTASVVGKPHPLREYRAIIDTLKKEGLTVQSDHIMQATECSIRMTTKEQRLAFLDKLEGWINDCDCMVVEASFPSISVGYEISLAIDRKKPVLILYSEGDPPSLFAYHHEENLICEKYSLMSLKHVIDDFLMFVKGTADMRFTFFVTPEIAMYLKKMALQEKIPKSVYLRKLIEADMKRP